jgi:signal transduction histidine kinase
MVVSREFKQAAALTLVLWAADVALYFAPGLVSGVVPSRTSAVRILLIGAGGVSLTGLLYLATRRIGTLAPAARHVATIAAAIACGGAVAGLDILIQDDLRRLLTPASPPIPASALLTHFLTNWIGLSWIFGLAGAIFLVLDSNRAIRERDQALADARAAALEAQGTATAARLAALRYQLNPHFLFNTLNAVSSAVVTHRTAEAETMLSRLAEFLRVTLAADPEALIPLEEEFETLHVYLAIEGERFRDRLAVHFVCPDVLLDAQIPSFLLQPLVENAVKHGVARTRRTVTLRVEAMQDGEDLVVIVEDDAVSPPPRTPGSSGGVGLENIRARLQALYGARGVLQATPRESGFLAMVRMPLRRAEEAAEAA